MVRKLGADFNWRSLSKSPVLKRQKRSWPPENAATTTWREKTINMKGKKEEKMEMDKLKISSSATNLVQHVGSNATDGIARERNVGFERHARWQVVRGSMQPGLHVEPINVSGIVSNYNKIAARTHANTL